MKLFLDTNYFLDFYRHGKEHLSVFEDIKSYTSNLIFPEQVFKEFKRRVSDVQNQELKKLRDSHSAFFKPPTSLIKGLEVYEEYKQAKSEFKKISDSIISELQSILDDRNKDLIYKNVLEIYKSKDVTRLVNSPGIIERAKTRHLLGDPPGSSNVTIGDEVIWECILENVREDLVLITNDNSFRNNIIYLQEEFLQTTGCKIFLVDKLSEAITKLGGSPSKSIEEYEVILIPYSEVKEKIKEKGFLYNPGEIHIIILSIGPEKIINMSDEELKATLNKLKYNEMVLIKEIENEMVLNAYLKLEIYDLEQNSVTDKYISMIKKEALTLL